MKKKNKKKKKKEEEKKEETPIAPCNVIVNAALKEIEAAFKAHYKE